MDFHDNCSAHWLALRHLVGRSGNWSRWLVGRWLVVEDYVMFKLAGVYATDYSIASRTMGFDVQRKCWSEELFAAAGLDPGFEQRARKLLGLHPPSGRKAR